MWFVAYRYGLAVLRRAPDSSTCHKLLFGLEHLNGLKQEMWFVAHLEPLAVLKRPWYLT